MPFFSGEDELISLFECEPTLLDNNSKDMPFYYNATRKRSSMSRFHHPTEK